MALQQVSSLESNWQYLEDVGERETKLLATGELSYVALSVDRIGAESKYGYKASRAGD